MGLEEGPSWQADRLIADTRGGLSHQQENSNEISLREKELKENLGGAGTDRQRAKLLVEESAKESPVGLKQALEVDRRDNGENASK